MAKRPSKAEEFFFLQIGSFVAVIVYFVILSSSATAPAGVYRALPSALAVMCGYSLLAYSRGFLKHFDYGLLSLFGLGTVCVYAGSEAALAFFADYSPVALFITLGLVASLPLVLGREPFTVFFAKHGTPTWQQATAEFGAITRIMSGYFAVLFFCAAAIVSVDPHDLWYSVVYPNLLIFVAGIPSQFWFPPLYLKMFPIAAPETVEAAIMGMPLSFDSKAAGALEATLEFHVSGQGEGDYHLRIAGGKCESFEGRPEKADLTITTPGEVWLRIARGELAGDKALQQRLYSATGDFSLLLRLDQWFPRRAS